MIRRLLPVILGGACLGAGALVIGVGGAHLYQNGIIRAAAAQAVPEIPARPPMSGNALLAQAAPIVPDVVPSVEPPVSAAPRAVVPTREPVPGQSFERVAPRAPLSDLYGKPTRKSEAKPVEGQQDWRMTRLFNAVASAAGRIEAKGHKVALAGIEPLAVDEKCDWNGTEWPCGTVGRTAFRQWLRTRAVQCKVPQEAASEEISSECYIGKTDMAEWLISNGWARPMPEGPYYEAGEKAKTAKAGIYGEPPRRVMLTIYPSPSVTDSGIAGADPSESTPDELNQEPEPGFVAPPLAPEPGFPPAPAEPTP